MKNDKDNSLESSIEAKRECTTEKKDKKNAANERIKNSVSHFVNHAKNQYYAQTLQIPAAKSDSPADLSVRPCLKNCRQPPQIEWKYLLRLMKDENILLSDHQRYILFFQSNQEALAEHTHDFFEMIYVCSGICCHSINGKSELLKSGDFCILPPLAHHIQSHDITSIVAKLLVLPSYFTDICPGLLQDNDTLGSFFINSIFSHTSEHYLLFHTEQSSEIRKIIQRIAKETRNDTAYSDQIVSGLVMALLSGLAKDFPADVQFSPIRNISHEIMSVMQKEYDTITLESLAARLHYSVPYCSKYIKKLFGSNFSSLLKQIRFQRATEFLLYSDMTVNQISKRIGYENTENFIRAFKQMYHLTPTQYRLTPKARRPEPDFQK